MTVFMQCIDFVQQNKVQKEHLTSDDKLWNQTLQLGVKIMLKSNTTQEN